MTPNPKGPRFIRYDMPKGAPKNVLDLYEEFQTLHFLAQQENWRGLRPENIVFEYSTYDNDAEILINFGDRNNHSHKIIVSFNRDGVSTTCWISYRFTAENFDENARFVQSFAEYLMLQLWDLGLDAELCDCDWGLVFSLSIDSIAQNVNLMINTIISSIKPMEWFYSNETIWKFRPIYSHLLHILPELRHEAETGRWKGVKPENFTLLRDNTQAYIILSYQDPGIYDMSFKVGFDENGFDPDVSGEWLSCEYQFHIRTKNSEVRGYYTEEQKQCCRIASTILDMTSYNAFFAYDQEDKALTLLIERRWAFQKYCLMLDIVLPIIFKYEASKPLVTTNALEQKNKLEALLNTTMEIVEDNDDKYIFAKGGFISAPENPNTIYNEEMPF